LICNTDTVSCAQNIAESLPEVLSNCGSTTFIRGEVIREDLCRVSEEFLARETVVYAIQDQFGNVSDTCVQVRYITKPNLELEDIDFPIDTIVSCDAALFDSDGTVYPMIVGVPMWDGVALFNNRDIPQLCNVFAEFEDLQDLDVSCQRTIIRRWTVTEWRCDGGVVRIPMLQRIVLQDTSAPVITLPVTRVELSVNESGCTASFDIPTASVEDNCQPQNTIEIEVPLGNNNVVEYIARDRCGNESRDTILVDVLDLTAPVAVCLRETVISITGTEVTMTLDKFDQDSYDACGLAKVCVVRMEDQALFTSLNPNSLGEVLFEVFDVALSQQAASGMGCYRDYSAFTITRAGNEYITLEGLCTDRVTFCCSDAGRDIPIILRAYDMAGNTSECMVMVGVQDKSDPVITCPTEVITVSCDFDFDPDGDLNSLFGTIRNGLDVVPLRIPSEFIVDSSGILANGTYLDNCNLGQVIEL